MMPALRDWAVVFGLFLVIYVNVLFGRFFGLLRLFRPRGLLLVPPNTVMPEGGPPDIPPWPGAMLTLRDFRLLLGLLPRCLRWLVSGIPGLRVFFCHNCQTDYSGQEP